MKVKTFLSGLAEGYDGAFQRVDERIKEEMGENIKIYSIQDNFYESTPGADKRVARVVVYDTLDKKV